MNGIKGFTLIELLITLVTASILLSIGIPAFTNMFERNTVSTTSNELLAGILLARSEAIRQEVNTTFTPSSTGWQVDSGALNLLDHVVDNDNITVDGNAVTYNPRGRAALADSSSIDVIYEGEIKARICLSLTGRPFIRMVEDGVCP